MTEPTFGFAPVGLTRMHTLILASVAAVAFCAQVVSAQPASEMPPDAPAASDPRLGPVRAKIEELEKSEEIDPELKEKLLGLYRSAEEQLQETQAQTTTTTTLKDAAASAPAKVESIRKFLESAADTDAKPVVSVSEETTVSDLERQLRAAQSDVSTLESRRSALENQVQELTKRPNRAREELIEAKQTLQDAEAELKVTPPSEEAAPLRDARRSALLAQRAKATAVVSRLAQELLSAEPRLQLLSARRDQTAHNLEQATARVEALRELVTERRRVEAERAQREAERAQREAIGKHPVVQQLAKQNAGYGRKLTELARAQEATAAQRSATAEEIKTINRDFQSARQRLEVAGLSAALGQLLRDQRRKLPELRRYRREAAQREGEMAKLGLAQFQTEDEWKLVENVDKATERLVRDNVDETLPAAQRDAVKAEVRTLLDDQRELLSKLGAAYASQRGTLGDLDFEQHQLLEQSRKYAAYLDERLLWIPNAPVISLATLQDLFPATAWFLAPNNWIDLGRALINEFLRVPALIVLALVAFAVLLGVRSKLRRSIRELVDSVGKVQIDSVVFTLRALLITLLLALPWPLLMIFAAWRLHQSFDAPEFAKAVAAGLSGLALPLLLLRGFFHLCHAKGVALVHFRWREKAVALLRRHLRWFTLVILSTFFVTVTTEWYTEQAYYQSLGRVSFIAGMIAFAVFAQRLLHPRGAVVGPLIARHPNGWLCRLRNVWYPTGVGIPLVLAVLAAIGYFYTARQLDKELTATLWLVFAAVFLNSLVMRALMVAQRKLAWKKALEKREAARAAQADGGGQGAADAEGAPVALDTSEVDLATINTQTRQLVKNLIGWSFIVGLWLIWADVLPALGVLDNVAVWQQSVTVDGQEQLAPITLADLAFAMVVGVILVIAARNIPGVLEIAILQRLPLDFGSRYAITTMAQYTIVAIGAMTVFTYMGVGWSQVQWLVAALGVGLGFGLQEIFANFVSGLIILFERPVRIGDTVTIGDLSGTVSRMRMRATTITDWDNKEIIVPNKTFITDRLINWTLSNPITRVVIPIGIAYGSDTNLAYRVINEAAGGNPLVLDEPPPQVFFLGFGDSSLDFELRVFVEDLGDRLPVIHELHMVIDRALREHNIEIPFPQRDIHIRSSANADQASEAEQNKAKESPLRPVRDSKSLEP